jgi:chorismate--pyruvate lyase
VRYWRDPDVLLAMSPSLTSPRRALREARWTLLQGRRLPGVSTGMQAWLRDAGSLTRAVVSACDGVFDVELVAQRHAAALPSETRLLQAGPARAMQVREVRLRCAGQPWVFARTLIPMRGLHGAMRDLTRLGQRPLGEVLFSDPLTRRLRVEAACLRPRHWLFARATAHLEHPPACLWGRRTLFEYDGRPILVNELFLPGIPATRR